MQSVNHQIGVCIDAVGGFPGIGIVAGLNGLIDPFAIAQAQQGFRVAELFWVLLSGAADGSPKRWQAIVPV